MNTIQMIDGYKLDHRRQYPKDTRFVQSNWTPRESRVLNVFDVTHVGLQYFLTKYMMGDMHETFFGVPKAKAVADYKRRVDAYLGPNDIGTEHIEALHDLGYMPLSFRAIPEGMSVPLRVPMIVVENTHPDFFWLVNYIETMMSNILWMPCTSATNAGRIRRMMDAFAKETGAPDWFVDYQAHDFSMRGMAGMESAALSGMGHLVHFNGTDTLPAIELIEQYYGDTVGASVAATEHSVMSAGGPLSERETFEHILHLYPSGIVSVVSDTWDLWNVITNILPAIKDQVMARDGKLVIRPDSGDPADIICGSCSAEPGSPASKGVVQLLWEVFGGTENAAGYKELDPHIGCIYGDGINFDRAQNILGRLMFKGFSSGNIVFGIGSYTYQYVTRDTFGFAMKATWAQIGDAPVDLFKTPKTDNGVKNSAKGRVAVKRNAEGRLYLVDHATPADEAECELVKVWQDGLFRKVYSFAEVRANARQMEV